MCNLNFMKYWWLFLLVGVFILGMGCTGCMGGPAQTVVANDTNNEVNSTNVNNSSLSEVQQCFSDLGYDGLVFVYSPTCPHCHRMQPIVDDLVSKGLNIQKVNSFEQRSVLADINNNCLTLKPYVPQFICPVNGEVKVGEMSEDELQSFYNSCFSS